MFRGGGEKRERKVRVSLPSLCPHFASSSPLSPLEMPDTEAMVSFKTIHHCRNGKKTGQS